MEANEYEGSEDIEYLDEKWNGVPPVGQRPPPSRTRFILEIMAVLVIEFMIWGLYRKLTAPIYGAGFNMPFFIGHIIAAPTIHLGPILLYWKFIRKEKLFYKDDMENGEYRSFNFGPFKLTKKRLMTAVLVGLFGGVMWRMAEMLIGNFSSVIMGGTEFFSLTWMDVFSLDKAAGLMDYPTFFMMTFVMFFIVGPVEEFEFRAFTHDQSQRVLPQWAALVFSSVFFGLSHIPIAIFIYMPQYNLTVTDLIFMEISWMAAGATFGALYMWSRNIFAVIVMHGIGNWQLSVFWLTGRSTIDGLSHTQTLIADLLVSIFANGIMIAVFYLVHRFYWAPQQRGEAAFGGKLMKVQQFFFQHDNSQKKVGYTGGALAGVIAIVLIILFSISAGIGVKDWNAIAPSMPDDNTGGDIDLTMYVKEDVVERDIQNLDVGGTQNYTYQSTQERIVQKLIVDLKWNDETNPPANRIRPHENSPDTFQVIISYLNTSVELTAANPQDGTGTIHMEVEMTNEMIMNATGDYLMNVDVNMINAGMWTPVIGPGLVGLRDSGNEYEISLTISYLNSMMNIEPETTDEMYISG